MESIISQYDSEKILCKILDECSKCHDYMVKNCIFETDCKTLKFLINVYVRLELVTQKKILAFQNYARQNNDIFFCLNNFIVNMKKDLEEIKKNK